MKSKRLSGLHRRATERPNRKKGEIYGLYAKAAAKKLNNETINCGYLIEDITTQWLKLVSVKIWYVLNERDQLATLQIGTRRAGK